MIEIISSSEYHARAGASHSRLEKLRQSPAHLKHSIEHPDHPTAALIFGSALHCAILEPDLFASRYVCPGKIDKRTKEGKAQVAELEASGKIVLSEDDNDAIKGIGDSIRAHEAAAKILALAKSREVSMFWSDPVHQVACKARLDAIAEDIGAVVDLKTTTDASLKSFEKSIFNFGYHRQGAHYIQAARAEGLNVSDFILIAVEKEAPYAVAVYRLSGDALAIGDRENTELLGLWADCEEKQDWPAYSTDIQEISLPPWAINRANYALNADQIKF